MIMSPGTRVFGTEDRIHSFPKIGQTHLPSVPEGCNEGSAVAHNQQAAGPRTVNEGIPADTILDQFSAATARWFRSTFAEPTSAQTGAWQVIAAGQDALVVAPTGSGKTLAAFLWSLDKCVRGHQGRTLYISPLKALASDIERNLRSPLTGIAQAAAALNEPIPDISVGVRTGDTPPDERRRQARNPPDVWITTPESLFLLMTSAARDALADVDTVIIDEVHALAGTKRGAHLALTLARLEEFVQRHNPDRRLQFIGLSATARPVEQIASFLRPGGEVVIVEPPAHKKWQIDVVVPVDDMANMSSDIGNSRTGINEAGLGDAARTSLWPHVEERLVDLISDRRATLVFVNSRRLAERLTSRLNEVWAERTDTTDVLARAHHGSVSKDQRRIIEEDLKAGRLPAVVATSSMELGIDMGAIDLVVQVESPPSVASGLQRIGRAGHHVGATSHGVFFPKYRGDLIHTAVVAERMQAGEIESLAIPRNPLDVLAQQVIAAVAMDTWSTEELLAVVRRTASFADLGDRAWEATLDMLSGRYPSDDFAELRPRLVWDRIDNTLTARPGAQRLAVTSGGTIPDRGLFTVYLIGTTNRVGELDEEMVYESRVGDVFSLGATSWRIEDITHDRVFVSPAIGQVGRLPFWRGDRPGRPIELGEAIGTFTRTLSPESTVDRLSAAGLDANAQKNLVQYLDEQREATEVLPDDRTIVVERFRDELGDWRVVMHSPYGARVHAPWALALDARLRMDFDVEAQIMHSDDGIVLRLPDTMDEAAPKAIADLLMIDPDELDDLVTGAIGGSALFAGRFRECAARALLLPRRSPGKRSPLWQQRQRSAHLLSVAARYPDFPIVLETVRECLQDVFDLPGLRTILTRIAQREIRIKDVQTPRPSPFAQSLLFGYVAEFLYDGDAPLAERRAAALTLDTGLLAELMGQSELRDLLDADVIVQVIGRVGRFTQAPRDSEDVADLLRVVGPLSVSAITDRGIPQQWCDALVAARRAIRVRIGAVEHWAAIEDAAKLRDGLGTALPTGIPEVFLDATPTPVHDLLLRFARTNGPFTSADAASAFGLGVSVVDETLRTLVGRGRLVDGSFTPGRQGNEWCDVEVLRLIRRGTVAALRSEAEPVSTHMYANFLPEWHGLSTPTTGHEAIMRAVDMLAGAQLPAQQLESLILPARIKGYRTGDLDALIARGDIVWWGLGALPGGDGWISLAPADLAAALMPDPDEQHGVHRLVLEILASSGALFFRPLCDRVSAQTPVTDMAVEQALWSLVWAGLITNDSLAPLRAHLRAPSRSTKSSLQPDTGTGAPPQSQPALNTRRRLPRGTRARSPRGLTATGPPSVSGRWSVLDRTTQDGTFGLLVHCESLLERYGVVTRSAVAAEGLPGGFAAAYRVLSTMEEAQVIRRTYAIEGLGAAQFALPGAVDRLRSLTQSAARELTPTVWTLAASDPAQAYGSVIGWPPTPTQRSRPSRAAGAMVTLVDGMPVWHLERGLRTLTTWPNEADVFDLAAQSLVSTLKTSGQRCVLQRIDGQPIAQSGDHRALLALQEAGFTATPRGLTLYR